MIINRQCTSLFSMPQTDVRVRPLTLLTATLDIIKALKNISKLYGACSHGVVPYQPDFKRLKLDYCVRSRKIDSTECLKVLKVFKPLYHPVYYKRKNPYVPNPKVILLLEMLQRSCLVLMVMCDDALHKHR